MKYDRKLKRKPLFSGILKQLRRVKEYNMMNREVIIQEVKIMLRWKLSMDDFRNKQTRRSKRNNRGRRIKNNSRR